MWHRVGRIILEKDAQDSHKRIWIEEDTRHSGSLAELNAWLDERCSSK